MGICLITLRGHTQYVSHVIQLTDGRLVSGGDDHTLRIWDTISGSCLMTLEGNNDSVRSVIQLTDGRLVSCSVDNTLKIWSAISGVCLMTLEGDTGYMTCMVQLTDGRLVFSSNDRAIRIWNIMSLSQQKWIRRRLLVLLYETSKIFSEPPELAVIRQQLYPSLRLLDPARCYDLDLLLRCSLNINNDINSIKVFKITLSVLSMHEITTQVAEYL